MGLVDELLGLRLDVLKQCPEYRLEGAGRAALFGKIEKLTNDPAAIELLKSPSGVRAAMVLGSPRPGMLGLENIDCELFCRPQDQQALKWMGEVIADWMPTLDGRFVLVLDPTYRSMLTGLTKSGLVVQALVLHGDPQTALGAFDRSVVAERRLVEAGLVIEPLSQPEQVESLVQQRRDYFSSTPDHSPVSSQREIDESLQAKIDNFVTRSLLTTIDAHPTTQYVVLRGSDVVGGFGLNLSPDHPLLGHRAGVEIFLARSIHRRGVGTAAYLTLLGQMLKLKVDVFKGTTANPGVIHLARKMRRPLRGWKLVVGPSVELPEKFDYGIV